MKSYRLSLLLALCIPFTALAAPEPDGNRFALVIGITGYPNFRAADRLQYADSDARLFADFLESAASGGFAHENIRILLNEKATRSNIFKEIEWIGSHAYSNDIVYIYFAGHGVVDDSDLAYLMPYDADPTLPGAEGFRADEFMKILRTRISAKREIFFVDACHAAAIYGPDGATRRDAGNVVPQLRALWQAQPTSAAQLNMAFLSAASNQFSLEDDAFQHGVFTYYLVNGLTGRADSNHDGKVTAEELRNYIGENVAGYAQRKQSAQTPTVSPAFDPALVLSIYSAVSSVSPEPSPAVGERSAPGALVEPNRRPQKLAMVTKIPPPEFSLKASARPTAARGGQPRFDYDIRLDVPAPDRGRIAKVVYDFVLADNPLHFESTNPGNEFAVTYNGWGCYSDVRVTVTLTNTIELQPRTFNMCGALGIK